MSNRKCVICGQPILDNKDSVPYKSRYAHTSCFNSMVKLVKKEKTKESEEKLKEKKQPVKKPKAELKDAMSEELFQEKMKLINFMKELAGEDILSPKTYSLLSNYIDHKGMTYTGIYETLKYMFVYLDEQARLEKKLRLDNKDCLPLVPYIYDEAHRVIKSINKAEEYNSKFTREQIENMYKVKTVQVTPRKPDTVKQIDLSKIGEE